MSVLIIADRESDDPVALPRGFALAEAMGWEAEVVGFCYEPLGGHDPADGARAKRELTARRRESLNAWIREHGPAGIDIEPIVVWEKSVATWVASHVRHNDTEVVVKTGHRSETLVYRPTDWNLLRECEAPVLIVAEHAWNPKRSVVAAVDLGSRSSVKQNLNDAVIRSAKAYATALQCPLYLVYVIHVSAVLKDLEVIDTRAHVARVRRRLIPVMTDIAKTHGISPGCINIEWGEVDRMIPSTASRLKAQLVVMGTVGRQGVRARLIGNTAERVLTRLHTDVLALRPAAANVG